MSNPSPIELPTGGRTEEFVDTVLIARPRHELYAFWRDFSNLPKFMEKVRRVTEVDSLSSIWTVTESGGNSADWEFLVTDDEADRLIAWTASGHTPVKYSGRVEFKDTTTPSVPAAPEGAPAASGPITSGSATPGPVTEVTATLRYEASAGLIEHLILRMAGRPGADDDPAVQTRGDLLRFKELMEGGHPVG